MIDGEKIEKLEKRRKLEESRYKVSEEQQLKREEFNRKLKEELQRQEDEQENNNNSQQNNVQENEKEDKNIKKTIIQKARTDCPYLSTIKRNLIDFDFEKLCSVTLNNLNVYACLICSKYFQGRGKGTHAYIHSLDEGHHIFINLFNTKVYCLPENYEVDDHSLEDIKYNLKPQFTQELILKLDQSTQYSRALNGTKYYPGMVGMNNLSNTDYINVMIHALCRAKEFRNYFLNFENTQTGLFEYKTLLIIRFSELVKKIWNPRNFKGHVSPHELIQGISLKSNKKFQIGVQSDAIQLFSWFFGNMQKEFKNIQKGESIIKKCFEGEVEINQFNPLKEQVGYEAVPVTKTSSFFYLTLDIPEVPVYKEGQSSVPNVPIFELLKKFDGITNHDTPDMRRTYIIKKLPKYLVIHMKRFISNNFFMEKNPTIITFPLNNLNLAPYTDFDSDEPVNCKYSLIANICHEGQPKGGIFKIHMRHEPTNQWFEVQDLHIQSIIPQLVCVSQSYVQIWERQE